MSMFFVVHRLPDGRPECKHFENIDEFFAWLQTYYIERDRLPAGLMVYKAECLFDES